MTDAGPTRGESGLRDRQLRAAELWQGGLTYAQVATELGVAPGTVAAWFSTLRAEGVDLPRARPELWSSHDDERLLGLLRAGHSPAEIAEALDRPAQGAASRLRRLRRLSPDVPLTRRPERVKWNAARDDALVSGYRGGLTLSTLAAEAGCSIDSVFLRLEALRHQGHQLPPRRPRWTAEAKARLAERYREGATYAQLADEFERTHGTISQQLKRLRDDGVDLRRD